MSSKYAAKKSARVAEVQRAISLAMQITEGTVPPPRLPAPKTKTPPPEPRGTLVDLGDAPEAISRDLALAADALDRALAAAEPCIDKCGRSIQKSHLLGVAGLCETLSPRIRAAARRIRRMPAAPKGGPQ